LIIINALFINKLGFKIKRNVRLNVLLELIGEKTSEALKRARLRPEPRERHNSSMLKVNGHIEAKPSRQ
jgi:hypothetical protein